MEGSTPPALKVLAFCGSLRKGSFNRMVLRACEQLLPEGMALEVFEIRDVPLYDEDVRQQGFPPRVQQMREKIRASDALLFVSPEYNYSIPGVLKNAIDWASRPPEQPFAGKPAAVMGVSPSFTGTARMQYHLRQVFVYLDVHLVNQPEVMIAAPEHKFDKDGRLTDDAVRKRIGKLLEALAALARQLKAPATRQ